MPITKLSTKVRGMIGPDTGAKRIYRVVHGIPILAAIGHKLYGGQIMRMSSKINWLMSHPFPSLFNGDDVGDWMHNHVDHFHPYRKAHYVFAVADDQIGTRFIPMELGRTEGDVNPGYFVDLSLPAYAQRMDTEFDAVVGEIGRSEYVIAGKSGEWLVQLYDERNSHTLSSVTPRQFPMSDKIFKQYFIEADKFKSKRSNKKC